MNNKILSLTAFAIAVMLIAGGAFAITCTADTTKTITIGTSELITVSCTGLTSGDNVEVTHSGYNPSCLTSTTSSKTLTYAAPSTTFSFDGLSTACQSNVAERTISWSFDDGSNTYSASTVVTLNALDINADFLTSSINTTTTGESFYVTLTVTNTGTTAVDSVTVTEETSTSIISTQTISSVPAQSSQSVSWEVDPSSLEEGTYTITAMADAATTDPAMDTLEIIIMSGSVSASLESPVNGYNTTDTTVSFNCSATASDELVNVTLYGSWNSGWHANETASLTGTDNSTVFTRTLPEGTYLWNCLAYDNESNEAWGSSNYTINVDLTQPVISALTVTEGLTNATFTWTTDEYANSTVYYGTTTALGSEENSTSFVTSHSILVEGLSEGTEYYYNVTSCDRAGNCNVTAQSSFTTLSSGGSDSTAPVITLNSPADSLSTKDTGITFNCSATDNTMLANVTLWGSWNGGWHANETIGLTGVANSTTFTKVLAHGTYVWNCRGLDNSSNAAWASANRTLIVDTTAPLLIGISDTPSSNSVLIGWTTDEASNATVYYGNTSATLNSTTNSTLSTSHVFQIVGLELLTTYYYNISSCDALGNCNTSSQYSFMTVDDMAPTVSLASPANGLHTSATSVTFNCSATENYNLANFTLFGNWSGAWVENETSDKSGVFNYSEFTVNLEEGTYVWNCLVYDSEGNSAFAGANRTLDIDTTAPVISSIQALPSAESAAIRWYTNEAANATLYYRNSTSDTWENMTNTSFALDRIFSVTGLTSTTRYYYNVSSCDSAGNCNTTESYSFMTTDNVVPVVSLNLPVDSYNSSSASVTFNCSATDNVNLASVTLWGDWTGTWSANETTTLTGSANSTVFTKTLPEGTHIWNCKAADNSSNTAFGTNRTLTIDHTAPFVSGISTVAGSTNVTIGWTTDEAANATIYYGTTTETGLVSTYGAFSTSHTALIEGLSPETVYYYNISGCDSFGNCDITTQYNFTTEAVTLTSVLNSPVNYFNTSLTTVVFNCSAYDSINMTNITLWGSWNSGWHANESQNITGTDNSTTFTKVLDEGEYVWNCIVYDESGSYDWANANRTLNIDLTTPQIIGTNASIVDSTNVTVVFNTTESANVTIYYGLTNSTESTHTSSSFSLVHSVVVDGLVPESLYYYNVSVSDRAGNTNVTSQYNFTTGIDVTAPTLLLSPDDGYATQESTVVFNCTATDNYKLANITIYSNFTGNWSANGTIATSDTLNVSLFSRTLPEGTYLWGCTAYDNYSNVAYSANMTIRIDNTTPSISSVSASRSTTSATVTWTTDEAANSTVYYGTNVNTTLNTTSSTLVSSHSMALTSLTASTTYYYNVSSCDAAGNCNTSTQYTFTTSTPTTPSSSSGGGGGSSSSGAAAPPVQNQEGQDDDDDEGNGNENGETNRVQTRSRPEIVPGEGLENNVKLQAALEKVLGKAKMSDQARENMLRLSATITANIEPERQFTSDGEKSKITTRMSYKGQTRAKNFVVYEKIPKEFAASASEIEVSTTGTVEIVEDDPEYAIVFSELNPGDTIEVSYEIIGTVDASVAESVSSELYVEEIEEVTTTATSTTTQTEIQPDKGTGSTTVIIIAIIILLVIAGGYLYLKKKKEKHEVKKFFNPGEENHEPRPEPQPQEQGDQESENDEIRERENEIRELRERI